MWGVKSCEITRAMLSCGSFNCWSWSWGLRALGVEDLCRLVMPSSSLSVPEMTWTRVHVLCIERSDSRWLITGVSEYPEQVKVGEGVAHLLGALSSCCFTSPGIDLLTRSGGFGDCCSSSSWLLWAVWVQAACHLGSQLVGFAAVHHPAKTVVWNCAGLTFLYWYNVGSSLTLKFSN